MKNTSIYLLIVFSICLFQKNLCAQNTSSYKAEMEQWHKGRRAFLLSPEGWLNLEGLFWLKPGRNSFGSGRSNEIVYPNNDFPEKAGIFVLEKDSVTWRSEQGLKITFNDSVFSSGVIFEDGLISKQLVYKNYRWNIIKRDDKYGIRFRNLESETVIKFGTIEHYPFDEKFRIKAHLEKEINKPLMITNILGQINQEASPGKLVFKIYNVEYKLDALIEGDQLFIIFGDATSGKGTYASGRYLYTALPDAEGNTVIDFNKSFNPPCAFTNYATCPLPPKQNILPIPIFAGEKEYH